LQKTPLDNTAAFVIHGMCDDVMRLLMQKLNLTINPFKLKRLVRMAIIEKNDQKAFIVEGIDSDKTPYSLFTQVEIKLNTGTVILKSEPYIIYLCSAKGTPYYELTENIYEVSVSMQFHANYEEPPLMIQLPLRGLNEKIYQIEYDPLTQENKKWDNIIPIISH
jgi:hypothetical protein